MRICIPALALAAIACVEAGGKGRANDESPPVALGEPAVEYPPAVFMQGISGTVELRLFVDSAGQVVTESTTVLLSSQASPSESKSALAWVGLYALGQLS